jgi:hypothetical protein
MLRLSLVGRMGRRCAASPARTARSSHPGDRSIRRKVYAFSLVLPVVFPELVGDKAGPAREA